MVCEGREGARNILQALAAPLVSPPSFLLKDANLLVVWEQGTLGRMASWLLSTELVPSALMERHVELLTTLLESLKRHAALTN